MRGQLCGYLKKSFSYAPLYNIPIIGMAQLWETYCSITGTGISKKIRCTSIYSLSCNLLFVGNAAGIGTFLTYVWQVCLFNILGCSQARFLVASLLLKSPWLKGS